LRNTPFQDNCRQVGRRYTHCYKQNRVSKSRQFSPVKDCRLVPPTRLLERNTCWAMSDQAGTKTSGRKVRTLWQEWKAPGAVRVENNALLFLASVVGGPRTRRRSRC